MKSDNVSPPCYNNPINPTTKGYEMIATALKVQQATGESLVFPEVLNSAREIAIELCEGDATKLNRIAELMYKYSATLASITATNVTFALLSESEIDTMANEIREYDNLTQNILEENN